MIFLFVQHGMKKNQKWLNKQRRREEGKKLPIVKPVQGILTHSYDF